MSIEPDNNQSQSQNNDKDCNQQSKLPLRDTNTYVERGDQTETPIRKVIE